MNNSYIPQTITEPCGMWIARKIFAAGVYGDGRVSEEIMELPLPCLYGTSLVSLKQQHEDALLFADCDNDMALSIVEMDYLREQIREYVSSDRFLVDQFAANVAGPLRAAGHNMPRGWRNRREFLKDPLVAREAIHAYAKSPVGHLVRWIPNRLSSWKVSQARGKYPTTSVVVGGEEAGEVDVFECVSLQNSVLSYSELERDRIRAGLFYEISTQVVERIFSDKLGTQGFRNLGKVTLRRGIVEVLVRTTSNGEGRLDVIWDVFPCLSRSQSSLLFATERTVGHNGTRKKVLGPVLRTFFETLASHAQAREFFEPEIRAGLTFLDNKGIEKEINVIFGWEE